MGGWALPPGSANACNPASRRKAPSRVVWPAGGPGAVAGSGSGQGARNHSGGGSPASQRTPPSSGRRSLVVRSQADFAGNGGNSTSTLSALRDKRRAALAAEEARYAADWAERAAESAEMEAFWAEMDGELAEEQAQLAGQLTQRAVQKTKEAADKAVLASENAGLALEVAKLAGQNARQAVLNAELREEILLLKARAGSQLSTAGSASVSNVPGQAARGNGEGGAGNALGRSAGSEGGKARAPEAVDSAGTSAMLGQSPGGPCSESSGEPAFPSPEAEGGGTA
ncbi:hypothetical protein ABPG77_003771 [Micractinium sp. CCAP 211/92]